MRNSYRSLASRSFRLGAFVFTVLFLLLSFSATHPARAAEVKIGELKEDGALCLGIVFSGEASLGEFDRSGRRRDPAVPAGWGSGGAEAGPNLRSAA